MLFDYLFFIASIFNWLLLGLVIWGGKAIFSLNTDHEKKLLKKSLSNIVLFLVLLIILLKVVTLIRSGISLNHFIVSYPVSLSFFVFILYQLFAVFVLLFFAMLLSVRFGFKSEVQNYWVAKIMRYFILFLFFDFFIGLLTYQWFIFRLLSENIKEGTLVITSPSLSVKQLWLAVGLGLSLIVYFIFYITSRHRKSTVTVTGISVSYLIVLLFSFLLLNNQLPIWAPDIRFILNDSLLYLAVIGGISVLFLGIGSMLFLLLIYKKRNTLKNKFYFDYLSMHVGSFHAVCVAGLSLITFVPTLFLLWYR